MGDLPDDDNQDDKAEPPEPEPKEPTEPEERTEPTEPPPAPKAIVMGVDPGRHTVVHMATHLPGEAEARDWGLSRKHYYNCSGVTRSLAKQKSWDQGAPWQQLGKEGSLRATTLAPIIQHPSTVWKRTGGGTPCNASEPSYASAPLGAASGAWTVSLVASSRRSRRPLVALSPCMLHTELPPSAPPVMASLPPQPLQRTRPASGSSGPGWLSASRVSAGPPGSAATAMGMWSPAGGAAR